VQTWLHGQEHVDPFYRRIEPTFYAQDTGNEPFIDHDAERRQLLREVHTGNAQAFGQMSRSIGIYADSVSLIFDGQIIARLTHRIREYEITEAVHALRDSLDTRTPAHHPLSKL
ncbi:MAG: hypothetical protein ABL907_23650, partial [Hyphomicrobium sp.]